MGSHYHRQQAKAYGVVCRTGWKTAEGGRMLAMARSSTLILFVLPSPYDASHY